ncbi:MAG: hypothetical protein R3E66_23010 [bacterium]
MAKYYFGADEVGKGWDRYFALCNAFEVEWAEDDKPSLKTLNTWRVKSPKGFAFVTHTQPLVAQTLVTLGDRGATTFDADFDEVWAATAARAKALGAKAVLLSTPFDFSPSTTSRKLIADFGSKATKACKLPIIWENVGMWSPDSSAEIASSCGMTLLHDPFANFDDEVVVLGQNDAAILLNERAGARRNFDTYEIEALFDATSHFNRVFILLRGRFKWRHAREIKAMIDMLD